MHTTYSSLYHLTKCRSTHTHWYVYRTFCNQYSSHVSSMADDYIKDFSAALLFCMIISISSNTHQNLKKCWYFINSQIYITSSSTADLLCNMFRTPLSQSIFQVTIDLHHLYSPHWFLGSGERSEIEMMLHNQAFCRIAAAPQTAH